MFSSASKLMGEAIGTSDNCAVIPRDKIRQDSIYNQFLLRNEEVFFLLKSVKKEYFFTERAFMVVHGEAAVGTKRMIERYEYAEHPVSGVHFETAGMGVTDLDCELKFTIGNRFYSVDCKKQEAANAAAVFRCLVDLSNAQTRNAKMMRLAETAFARNKIVGENSAADDFAALEAALAKYNPQSYKQVLEASYSTQFVN
jgi:hypothetical protein